MMPNQHETYADEKMSQSLRRIPDPLVNIGPTTMVV